MWMQAKQRALKMILKRGPQDMTILRYCQMLDDTQILSHACLKNKKSTLPFQKVLSKALDLAGECGREEQRLPADVHQRVRERQTERERETATSDTEVDHPDKDTETTQTQYAAFSY